MLQYVPYLHCTLLSIEDNNDCRSFRHFEVTFTSTVQRS